jgi:hypothetical protein
MLKFSQNSNSTPKIAIPKIQKPTSSSLINAISSKYNSLKKTEMGRFTKVALLNVLNETGFQLKDLHNVGIKIGNGTYYKYLDNNYTFEKRKTNPKRIIFYEEIRKWVRSYLEANSSPSSHETVKIKNEIFPIRNLKASKREIYENLLSTEEYQSFKKRSPVKTFKLSTSYFYKLIKDFKIFKKPKKLTDLCPICEQLKTKGNLLTKEEIEMIELHRKIKNYQKDLAHKKSTIEYLKAHPNEVTIIVDFKENIRLNQGGREISSDFFNQSQRTVISFICYYLDNNILKKHAFTVISEFLSHNSIFIIECFKKILEQKWMKSFEKINLFQDNGPHFKNCYMMHYFSLEIPVDITLNFFGEYHGKSDADTFFSLLSRLKTTFEQTENITSTSQLIEKYKKYFETHGQSKEKSQENIYTFIELNDVSVPTHRAALKIPNIKLYYHFQFQNKKIKGGVTQENIENMKFSISLEEFNGVTKKSINVFKVIEKRPKLSPQFKGRIKRQKLFMENISEEKITKQKEKKEKKPKNQKRKREETFLDILEFNEKPMKIQIQESLFEDLRSVRKRNREKKFANAFNETETVLIVDDTLNEKRKNEKRTREESYQDIFELEKLPLKIQKSSPSINLPTNGEVFEIFENDGPPIDNVEKKKTKKEREEAFEDTKELKNKVTKKERKENKLSEIIEDIVEIEQSEIHVQSPPGLDLRSKRRRQRELNSYNSKNVEPILIGEHDEPDTRKFKPINFIVTRNVIGDGNCLYRCISYFLYNTEDRYEEIRQTMIQWITENPDHMMPNHESFRQNVYNHHKKMSVDQFIKKHKQNKKWGNPTCISAIAFAFEIDIEVIISTRTNSQHHKTGRNNNPKLTLFNLNKNHFVVVKKN